MSSEPQKPVVVRYPPSPTGFLHIGNVRTFVFNYLFAKKHGGKVIFRSEDTDTVRSKKEYEEYIVEALNWLGLDYDEFYRQSERGEIYKEYLQKLIDTDVAYISQETPTDEELAEAEAAGKTLRTSVIRLRNPGKVITFHDEVLGDISVDTTDLGDFIIARDIDSPVYHFTVVVDDYLMGVTHIIRGSDHVANTPRQILIQEALGAPRPLYVHVPLVLGADGQKLSKRHGATATLDYRTIGYLSDSILNFLAFIGWNPGTEQEIFSRAELIQAFSLDGLQKGAGIFNQEKLNWINREHIKKLPHEAVEAGLLPYLETLPGFTLARFKAIVPILVERINVWSDLNQMIADNEVQYFFAIPDYDPAGLAWKNSDLEHACKHLKHVYETLQVYSGAFESDDVKECLWSYAEEVGKGDVLWPLRYALSGREKSPDPFTLLSVFGKDESLSRIAHAIMLLEK